MGEIHLRGGLEVWAMDFHERIVQLVPRTGWPLTAATRMHFIQPPQPEGGFRAGLEKRAPGIASAGRVLPQSFYILIVLRVQIDGK